MGRTVASILLCQLSMAPWAGFAASADATSVDAVVEAEMSGQTTAAASQSRVEALDEETLAMVSEYNRELARYQDLVTYNDNMRQLLASQAAEKQRLEAELEEIEVVRRGLVPLLVEMVDVLDRFIGLDQPMLMNERRARVDELKTNMGRADVEIAEKYRRVIEAYQIEAEYGQTIEAYEGVVDTGAGELTVDFLRVGRVGLYYLSLDRRAGGLWDPAAGRWRELDDRGLDAVDFAMRVARRQAPPNLVPLPLWTSGAD